MILSPIRLILALVALCLLAMVSAPIANAAPSAAKSQSILVRVDGKVVGVFTFKTRCVAPINGKRARCMVHGRTKLSSFSDDRQVPRMFSEVNGQRPYNESMGVVRDKTAPARFGYAYKAAYAPVNLRASRTVKVKLTVATHNLSGKTTSTTSRTIALRIPNA